MQIVSQLESSLGSQNAFTVFKAAYEAVQAASRLHAGAEEAAAIRARGAARSQATRSAIFKNAINSDSAGKLLSRTRPTVIKMAKAGDILAVNDGRAMRFPRWQFDETAQDGLVPGLRRILHVMDASALRKAAWLIVPNRHFGNRAPIEVLRGGDEERVYQEAKTITSS